VSRRRVVVASANPGKRRELAELCAGLDIELVPQSAFGLPPAPETGRTFAENALAKARHAARGSGLAALADDSGLEVEALGGAPGVRSARYAGEHASDADNVAKLLAELEGVPEQARGARFVCCVALLAGPDDPSPVLGEGVWAGRILHEPRGRGGFGYDPVFYVPELDATAAELPRETKNALSHRARALRAVLSSMSDSRR